MKKKVESDQEGYKPCPTKQRGMFEDSMRTYDALMWPEPNQQETGKFNMVKNFETEYRDLYLHKRAYWEECERAKENARVENRQDQNTRWGTENRDKYRTFVTTPDVTHQ